MHVLTNMYAYCKSVFNFLNTLNFMKNKKMAQNLSIFVKCCNSNYNSVIDQASRVQWELPEK